VKHTIYGKFAIKSTILPRYGVPYIGKMRVFASELPYMLPRPQLAESIVNKKVRYFVLAAGMSLIVLGLLMLTSGWFNNLLLSLISFWKEKPPAPHWLGKLYQSRF
jgi:hypothetical protein